MNGKCPACRQDFEESKFRHEAVRPQKTREKVDKKKNNDNKEKERPDRGGPKRNRNEKTREGRGKRGDLSELRIVQKNVVHVIGLMPSIAKPEVLKRSEFFGQYGKLSRVTVSKVPMQAKMGGGSNNTSPVYSAYLTFERQEDAQIAIEAVDGYTMGNHMLRANFGTTKYCKKFLEGEKCERKDCIFLHHKVEDNRDKGGGRGNRRGKDKTTSRNGGARKTSVDVGKSQLGVDGDPHVADIECEGKADSQGALDDEPTFQAATASSGEEPLPVEVETEISTNKQESGSAELVDKGDSLALSFGPPPGLLDLEQSQQQGSITPPIAPPGFAPPSAPAVSLSPWLRTPPPECPPKSSTSDDVPLCGLSSSTLFSTPVPSFAVGEAMATSEPLAPTESNWTSFSPVLEDLF